MEKRELTCIGCPMGCQITVTLEDGEVKSVEGNTCLKGDKYARAEVTNPVRVVTSSVPAVGGEIGQVSVKTAGDIPKGCIFDVMEALRAVSVQAPVRIGKMHNMFTLKSLGKNRTHHESAQRLGEPGQSG